MSTCDICQESLDPAIGEELKPIFGCESCGYICCMDCYSQFMKTRQRFICPKCKFEQSFRSVQSVDGFREIIRQRMTDELEAFKTTHISMSRWSLMSSIKRDYPNVVELRIIDQRLSMNEDNDLCQHGDGDGKCLIDCFKSGITVLKSNCKVTDFKEIYEVIHGLPEIGASDAFDIDELIIDDYKTYRSKHFESKVIGRCQCTGKIVRVHRHAMCVDCQQSYCIHCMAPIIGNHVCDPVIAKENEETMTMVKPCPNCGTLCEKIDMSCDDMFCTICHTGFNWKTSQVITQSFHNADRDIAVTDDDAIRNGLSTDDVREQLKSLLPALASSCLVALAIMIPYTRLVNGDYDKYERKLEQKHMAHELMLEDVFNYNYCREAFDTAFKVIIATLSEMIVRGEPITDQAFFDQLNRLSERLEDLSVVCKPCWRSMLNERSVNEFDNFIEVCASVSPQWIPVRDRFKAL